MRVGAGRAEAAGWQIAGAAVIAAMWTGCSPDSSAAPGAGSTTAAAGSGGGATTASSTGSAGGSSVGAGGAGGTAGAGGTGSGGSAGGGAGGSGGSPPVDVWTNGFVDLTDGVDAPFEIPEPIIQGNNAIVMEVAGMFADLDGDGAAEVVLTHLFTDGMQHPDRKATVYRYTGDKLELVGPLGNGQFGGDSFLPKAIVDLDGDGRLDVLTANQIAWGEGANDFGPVLFFTDVSDNRGAVSGMTLLDIDSDGWTDVLIGGAQCQDGSPALYPLLRTALRTFTQRLDIIQQLNHGRSFAVTGFPVNGSPVLGTLISSCVDGHLDPAPFYDWKGDHFGSFQLLPPDFILTSPMGAALSDLDGDGTLDLTISGGASSYRHDYFSGATLPLTKVTNDTGIYEMASTTMIHMIPWGVAFLDFDEDLLPDVVTVHGNDNTAWANPAFYIGPQWTTVHRNNGGLTFTEVDGTGIRHEGQWKALTIGDLDGDGDPDLIVGGQARMPGVYRNDIGRGHSLALRLRGSTSNELGIGATVDIWAEPDSTMQRRLAGSNWSPGIVSEPLVFAGLGSATKAARVRITWPSGTVQELQDLTAGQVHTIDEPPVVALTPKGRHLPADGAASATVTVTPRNPDGTVKDGVVAVQVIGAGTAGEVSKVGDAWVCHVTAPGSPGSGTVQVTIDGTPVGVVPRIWWD